MKAGDNGNDQLIEALKDELEKALAEEEAVAPEDMVVAPEEEAVAEPTRGAKQDMVSRIRQLEEQLAEKERALQPPGPKSRRRVARRESPIPRSIGSFCATG